MENVTQKNEKSVAGAIKIDEKAIGDHLNQFVRQSVEDTVCGRLCGRNIFLYGFFQ